ncbi:HipA domain-containing protein [Salinicoccus albus]|uniref:HipA domain-containing protein n=1 Tax=Salinicoccus albus TaxID=418756 RepID=UPI00035C5361|nr:HipA domain-containing protein [Salinicoccus albus]
MFTIVDLSNWNFSYEKMVSGTRKKTWVKNSNQTYLFKEPKYNSNEIWTEKITAEIGKKIGFNTMEVCFAENGESQGVILKNFVRKDEESIEGAEILSAFIEGFDPFSLKDYFIENIFEALEAEGYLPFILQDLVDQFIFDILIANQDRHSENWAIIRNAEDHTIKFAPIYDNGSSLGFNLESSNMERYNSGEKKLSSFNNKSKSIIGVNCKERPKSKLLFLYLHINFRDEVIESCNKINTLSEEHIFQTLSDVPKDIMQHTQKEFVTKLLLSRKEMILDWQKECECHE